MPDIIRSTYKISQAENTLDALACRAAMVHYGVMEEMIALRKVRGLSQAQLAEMAGCSQATISRIEKGEFHPRHELLKAIADALGVHPGALFTMQELQARIIGAVSRMTPERQAAALVVLEAMADDSQPQQ